MNKKILMLLPDTLEKPLGGMGEQCKQMIPRISGYQFDIITSARQDSFKNKNYTVHPIRNEPIMFRNHELSVVYSQLALFSTASKLQKPDLIHAFDWTAFGAGVELREHFGVPLIMTVQLSMPLLTQDLSRKWDNYAADLNMLERYALTNADAIIQVSSSYASRYPKYLLNKTFLIGNGVDTEEWNKSDKINLPGERPIKVVYIGRFDKMKNVLAPLMAKIPEKIDLIYIGCQRGGIPAYHQAIIDASKNRKEIHYIGPKYNQDKINHLISADAVIMPSIHEPFGIVALEALASKSILLSSFRGGMGEFLNEKCAINCGTTPESISAALEKLVSLTDEQKRSYIDNGLAVCKEYSWQNQANKLKQVYDLFAPKSINTDTYGDYPFKG